MIPKFYRTLQYLSIDIVIGAVILLHFFSKPFEVFIEWPSYVLLASAVWLIYTVDHLRDAEKSSEPHRGRYLFHFKYGRVLKICAGLVAISSGVSLFFLPTSIFVLGGVLAVLCLIYLLFQAGLAKIGLKECYVSIMYTLGILIAPVALSGTFHVYSFVILFSLSFTNLLLFSWFEMEEDKRDSFTSVATVYGGDKTQKFIWILISFGLAFGISGFWQFPQHSIYLVLVLLLYWMMLTKPQWARKHQRYRAIGDGVFIFPILFELL